MPPKTFPSRCGSPKQYRDRQGGGGFELAGYGILVHNEKSEPWDEDDERRGSQLSVGGSVGYYRGAAAIIIYGGYLC